ncbi:hypothetical protein MAR_008421 [Mya arenaria]|uniref:Uncharacterized protein n=1 Tax=Mya arenaria TaxID=6604 RepID=A0ABY7DVX9_MYAAR|nr:hypothetical protein MAR_008421 [Mya arenaria]
MPATNFTWGRSEDSPIFQVFGGKRKSSLGEQDSSITTKSKRQCTEYHVTSLSCKGGEESEMESLDTQPRPTDQGIPNGQYGYMACPDMVQPCRHLAESQVWNTRVPPLPDSSGDHGNNNNNNCGIFNNNVSGFNAGAELNNNQNDMIMDLNDEVYSTAAPPQNLNPFPNTTPIPPHIPGAHKGVTEVLHRELYAANTT